MIRAMLERISSPNPFAIEFFLTLSLPADGSRRALGSEKKFKLCLPSLIREIWISAQSLDILLSACAKRAAVPVLFERKNSIPCLSLLVEGMSERFAPSVSVCQNFETLFLAFKYDARVTQKDLRL